MEWFEETLYTGLHTRLKVEKVLYEGDSEHQKLILFENKEFGRVLALNNVIQTTERDEFIYHEMLSHVPIFAHGAVKRVLVIGGGDGGMMEEVLKHRTVEAVTLVEIDSGVIDFSKKYLGSICKDAFDDPRVEIVIADGVDFVRDTESRFDVIIVDSTDPIGPGEVLFTQRFYAGCKSCLSPGGIVVTQNGVPYMQADELKSSVRILSGLFADVGCYTATVPMYAGGCMAFGWATDNPDIRSVTLPILQDRFAAAKIDTDYYTPAVHVGSFALPRYIERIIS